MRRLDHPIENLIPSFIAVRWLYWFCAFFSPSVQFLGTRMWMARSILKGNLEGHSRGDNERLHSMTALPSFCLQTLPAAASSPLRARTLTWSKQVTFLKYLSRLKCLWSAALSQPLPPATAFQAGPTSFWFSMEWFRVILFTQPFHQSEKGD